MPSDQENLALENNDEIVHLTPPDFNSKKVAKEIMQLALTMMSSDTHAVKALFLPILLKFSSSQEDDPAVNLAAFALISACFNTLLIVTVSPLFGINILAPTELGRAQNSENDADIQAESKKEITALFRNSLIYTAAVVPLIAPMLYQSDYLLTNVFKQDPRVALVAQSVLRPFTFLLPSTFLSMATLQFLQSFQSKEALVAVSIALFSCLAAAFALGQGVMGLPRFGRDGVVGAYMSESYLSLFIGLGFLIFHPKFRDYPFIKDLPKNFKNNLRRLKKLLGAGFGITISILSEMLLYFAMATMAGYQSLRSQQLFTLALQVLLLNNPFGIHFSLASMIMLGITLGKKIDAHIISVARTGVIITGLICTIIPAFFALYPKALSQLFEDPDQTAEDTLKTLIPMAAIGSIADSLRMAFVFQLRILGDMKASTAIYITCQFLGLFLTAMLAYLTEDIHGILAGYLLAASLSALILGYRWHEKLQPYQIQADESKQEMCCSRFSFFAKKQIPSELSSFVAEEGVQLENMHAVT